MIIIGITGTNGKTTSAYLIYQALNMLHMKCAYIGTIGYYLDNKVCNLPNTSPDICDIYDMIVNAYDNGFKYIVMEVSSQGLAYDRFSGIEFNYALFTNLTIDHLDYHKTMENYALAKQKLFKQCKGINIINNDVIELYINIPCNDGFIVVNTNDLNTKSDVTKKEVNINTKGTASISEVTCSINLYDEKNINELKEKVNKEIERIINDGFMFARDNGSDVFGFGLKYYRDNTNEYKSLNWYDVYSNLKANISVNINIKSSGSLKQSIERVTYE